MNMLKPTFKVCPLCRSTWPDREALLNDATVELKGYQVNTSNPPKGLFIFLHMAQDCQTSFAVEVDTLFSLLPNLPALAIARPFVPGGQPDCKGHCFDPDNLEECYSQSCYGRAIRQLLTVVRERLQRV